MTQMLERPASHSADESDTSFSQQMDDYDNKYFADRPDQDGSWPIRTKVWYEDQTSPLSEADTQPMPADRVDLEAVEDADTLEDALREYDSLYSHKAIDAGEQSPQLCAEMLLRIAEKFDDDMTPEQRHAVALEAIDVGHAIGHMAEKPPEETIDRTNLKGLAALAEIISIAQEHAPTEIPTLVEDLQIVADKVDSRGSISGPFRIALEEFNKLQPEQKDEIPFIDIVEKISHEQLNLSNYLVLERSEAAKKTARENQARRYTELAVAAATSASSPEVTGAYRPEATGVYNPVTSIATAAIVNRRRSTAKKIRARLTRTNAA